MRRWLFFAWFAVLLAPAAGLLGPWEPSSVRESRILGQPPHAPGTLEEGLALPRETDAFVRDQFAGRDLMIRINASIRRRLNDEPAAASPVVEGDNGFLLLREGLAQSIGVELSPVEAQFSGALVCEIQRRVEERGAKFLYAIPPSPAEIYPDITPDWMGEPAARTDYDLLMEAARECGAHTLDLRPVLRAERDRRQLYRRTDTHWTERGALLAYDAVMAAAGHSELAVDGDQILWRRTTRLGDLRRMRDAEDTRREAMETPLLNATLAPVEQRLPTPPDYMDHQTFIRDYPREGVSVLIIGDSFTGDFFSRYLAPTARRVGFTHHRRCGFDWRDVERADADVVLFLPTERMAICPIGARPLNFD